MKITNKTKEAFRKLYGKPMTEREIREKIKKVKDFIKLRDSIKTPSNSWLVHLNSIEEAKSIIDEFQIKNETNNALWDYFHIIVWHKGLCLIRWIIENKSLAKQLSSYEWISDVPENLDKKVRKSIKDISKNYN